ncbi:peptidase domain-containing ABC transporter [Xanthovirga aplysinae]|uniref:peptidase domain-containing ABC transporter n=1 Tax=Xanthovirga aplysinae TaxID=2529853 RepID=UPI0012BB4ACD|nr:ABC transporter ATP-binding protein [Xanthovirga aplysinae]MTI30785.1 ABC transporter ATP-binding protein [Xanthovirga aplysinae]
MKEEEEAGGTIKRLRRVRRLISLLSVDKKAIFYIYVYAVFAGLIKLSLPLGIQAIINFIQGGQVSSSWAILVFIVILGVALAGGLQIMQLVISEKIQQGIFARSAFEFAYRIPRLKFSAVYKHYLPELINRFFDTLELQKGVAKILTDFTTAAIQILFGLILLSFYHPFFVTYGLLFLVILLIIFRILWGRGLRLSLKESGYKFEVAHWLEELGRNLGTFKLAGESELPLERTDGCVNNYLSSRKKHFKVLVLQYAFTIGFNVIVVAGLLVLGGVLVIKQQMNIGQFVAADIVIILIMTSVEKLILSLETIYDVVTALEKIGSVTDLSLEEEKGIPYEEIVKDTGLEVALHQVSFSYPNSPQRALENLNFKIEAGEKVAICGANESGKSTLIHLIGGLFDDYTGTVTYNGVAMGNINIASLRGNIGDSLSFEDLFEGSLYENITMGKKNISYQQILDLAKHLDLHDYIKSLPEGLASPVDSQGKKLSASIKRKIILLRGTVSRPRLLLLEDSMALFGKDTKEKIINYLTDKNNPWTLISVSNDESFAAKCDKVVILDKGKIIGIGKLDDFRHKPWFSKLFGC